MKKERTRNLLPAKVGIYGILIFLGHTIIWQLAFSLKVSYSITAMDEHKIVDVDAKIDKLWCSEHGQQRARADGGHGDGLLLLPLLPRAGAVRLHLR